MAASDLRAKPQIPLASLGASTDGKRPFGAETGSDEKGVSHAQKQNQEIWSWEEAAPLLRPALMTRKRRLPCKAGRSTR
jgi:hypothetical protein